MRGLHALPLLLCACFAHLSVHGSRQILQEPAPPATEPGQEEELPFTSEEADGAEGTFRPWAQAFKNSSLINMVLALNETELQLLNGTAVNGTDLLDLTPFLLNFTNPNVTVSFNLSDGVRNVSGDGNTTRIDLRRGQEPGPETPTRIDVRPVRPDPSVPARSPTPPPRRFPRPPLKPPCPPLDPPPAFGGAAAEDPPPPPGDGCICIQVYQPVCAVTPDGTERTFSNECFASCAGATVIAEGEC